MKTSPSPHAVKFVTQEHQSKAGQSSFLIDSVNIIFVCLLTKGLLVSLSLSPEIHLLIIFLFSLLSYA